MNPKHLAEVSRLLKMRAEISLVEFFHQAWHVIEPGTTYIHNWHIELICEYLEDVLYGNTLRLLINEPPRYLKSTVVTIVWPVWCWLHDPTIRWMFTSYSADLALFHSRERRKVIQSEWFQRNWGDKVRLSRDQNQAQEYVNTERGRMFSTSVGGTSTGKGGEILVFDDPINPMDARSESMRASANDWVRNTFLRRLNNKKTGRIVGVMQRLHEDDTTGLLMSFGGWTNLKLPAEAKERTVITFPRSGKVFIREKDDLLFPAREGPAEIAMAKKELGSVGYAGQYQQEPSPDIGGILHRDWWQRYGTMPARFDLQLQSWDCTFKDAITSDYVVGQVWGKIGAQYYLLDQVRGQWDIVATIAQVRRLSEKWPDATLKLVESAANGEAVIGMLKHELPGMLPINVQKAGGKVVRVQAISPMVEAGNAYLPTDALAPWADAFIDECAAFPNGKYDDIVDAASQALQRFLTMDKLRTRIFFQRLSEENYYTDATRPDQLQFRADRSIPCAYGTAAAACVFLDIFDDGETIWIDNEYYHLGSERGEQKSDDEYVAEYKIFQGDDNRCQGTCYCDPDAEAFQRALRAADIAVWTTKFDLLPGIRYAQSLLERREIRICAERCPRLVQELNEYAWDETAAKSGIEKPMKGDDYAIKALLYFIQSGLAHWRLTK